MTQEMLILPLVLTLVASLGVYFFFTRGRGVKKALRSVEEERQKSWEAVVTRVEEREVQTGRSGTYKMLTVSYERQDKSEGGIVAYEGDALRWTYIGALAYYKEAPGYEELSTWRTGDHLIKSAGTHFPRRA